MESANLVPGSRNRVMPVGIAEVRCSPRTAVTAPGQHADKHADKHAYPYESRHQYSQDSYSSHSASS